jgi:hypothetical protein
LYPTPQLALDQANSVTAATRVPFCRYTTGQQRRGSRPYRTGRTCRRRREKEQEGPPKDWQGRSIIVPDADRVGTPAGGGNGRAWQGRAQVRPVSPPSAVVVIAILLDSIIRNLPIDANDGLLMKESRRNAKVGPNGKAGLAEGAIVTTSPTCRSTLL